MNVISIKNLKKEFESYERGEGFLEAVKSLFKRKNKIFKAVDDVSFDISEGEIVGFIGPNGAGKSTTIKILSGIMYPTSGNVNVLGFTPWKKRKKYVRNIGVVFGQKSQLFWDLPPIDAFHMHKAIYSLNDAQFKKQLDKLTDLLELKEIMKRPTRQLSLGERMRCEFVMAMLHNPKIVFLDEPTIGLDVFAKETIRSFIKKVNKEENITFLVTSHDLEDIEHLCNKVIIINEGKIVFNDSKWNLKTNHKKYITVKFYDKVDIEKIRKLKGVEITKVISEYALKMKADTNKIPLDLFIKKIRAAGQIEDLDVTNPPLSEIIKKMYRH